MDDTRGSGQESENENPWMTELRAMVQILVGAVTAQQQLLQQHFQPPQPVEGKLNKGTSEYRGGQVQVCQKCGRYHWGTCWNDSIEVRNEIRCFHCNEVGHIKRNYSRLRTEAITLRGGPVGGNVRPVENARPGVIGQGTSGTRVEM
ncbi:hypothetical protein Acr_10g0009670 [Actinidia rufa]|uniref:CCHC-type domain-containing protein n=1 Tax=Actinidia rufa TaxID=165716 RepID=A0A7J0FA55_9ERIC|nr:hypothetical protein Acr_10g0009670 [Actinidia rufa]